MLAHIAGMPVEEAALSLVPVGAAIVGAAGLRLRNLIGHRPSERRRAHAVEARPR